MPYETYFLPKYLWTSIIHINYIYCYLYYSSQRIENNGFWASLPMTVNSPKPYNDLRFMICVKTMSPIRTPTQAKTVNKFEGPIKSTGQNLGFTVLATEPDAACTCGEVVGGLKFQLPRYKLFFIKLSILESFTSTMIWQYWSYNLFLSTKFFMLEHIILKWIYLFGHH
jgi:hypothetical protein